MKYRIVGNHSIDGIEPGKTVDIADEQRARRLVRAGHLEPKPTKPKREETR